MRNDEQLRRRNPKAHTAMILGRRERDLRQFKNHAPSHSLPPAVSYYPMASTQPVRWDAPMIATGDMLLPPSTAPDAASGTGNMLYTPLPANPNAAIPPTLDQPKPGSLASSSLEAGQGASIKAPKQMQTSFVAPRLSRNLELTSHDLQNHVEESITFLSNSQVPELEEALGEAVGNLFGVEPLNGSPITKGIVPKALQKATREDFQAIISQKCLENKYEQMSDPLRTAYARSLRNFIIKKAKTEEEHRHLASGLRHLLDKESVSPEILLKVLIDKLRPVKPGSPRDVVTGEQAQRKNNSNGQPQQTDGQTKRATPAIGQKSDHHTSVSIPISGVMSHETEMNRKMNESKESKEGRKHSIKADEEQSRKKARRAPAYTPNFASSEAMKKTFDKLLSREANRTSNGRS